MKNGIDGDKKAREEKRRVEAKNRKKNILISLRVTI